MFEVASGVLERGIGVSKQRQGGYPERKPQWHLISLIQLSIHTMGHN
jgi:hypothetical protein